MEHHFQQAVDLAVDPIDYYRVYKIKIDSQIAQGRLIEAIEIANVISKILGFSLPNKPGLMRLTYEYLKHKFIFLLKPVKSLKHQAEMTNEKARAFIEVLSSCSTAAHHTNPLLFLIIILTEINVFKKYGINSKIPFGTAAYGVLSCCKFAIAQGVQYGQLGLEMFDQHDDDNAKARTLFIRNLMLRIWRYPLKESLPGLMEAHRTATQAGDNEFPMLALWGYSYHAYSLGAPLSQLNDEMNRFRALIIETKQTTTLKWHSLFHQAAANWMGDGENPSLLIGDLCDERTLYQSFTETNDLTGLGVLGFNKVLLCCYYKQHEEALKWVSVIRKNMYGVMPVWPILGIFFYGSISKLGLYTKQSRVNRVAWMQHIAFNQFVLKILSDSCPENFLQKYHLVEAERFRVLGDAANALHHYELSIKLSREHDFLNDEALANELTTDFFIAQHNTKIAGAYLREAYHLYKRWGATAKLSWLDKTHHDLLSSHHSVFSFNSDNPSKNTSMTTTRSVTDALDLSTMMKTAHAISREIRLDSLLTHLIHSVVENVGSESGFIV